MTVRLPGPTAFAPDPPGEGAVSNERRYRAAVDEALTVLTTNDRGLSGVIDQLIDLLVLKGSITQGEADILKRKV